MFLKNVVKIFTGSSWKLSGLGEAVVLVGGALMCSLGPFYIWKELENWRFYDV